MNKLLQFWMSLFIATLFVFALLSALLSADHQLEEHAKFTLDGTNFVVDCVWSHHITDDDLGTEHVLLYGPEDDWIENIGEITFSLDHPSSIIEINSRLVGTGIRAEAVTYPVGTLLSRFDVRVSPNSSTTTLGVTN